MWKFIKFLYSNKIKASAVFTTGAFGIKFGDDLLSHMKPCSTIGAGGLNFSVRDGKRCCPSAIATENLISFLKSRQDF